jgi:hypothetical protein
MNWQRYLCYAVVTLLLAGGCVIGEVDTPLERLMNFPFMGLSQYAQHNDENSWSIYLFDEQTQQPLANVEIVRVDPIPNPDSIWSMIKYGEDDFIHTKLTQTDAQGCARIFKSEKITLEAMLDTAILRLNFDQLEANLIPLHLSNDEPQILKMQEVKPGHFSIMMPATPQSK